MYINLLNIKIFAKLLMILMFTTLLDLLYPPLKGFSHRLCPHIRVGHSLLLKPPRGAQAQELSHEKGCKVEDIVVVLNAANSSDE